MKGNLSVMSTTLAMSSAATVAVVSEERGSPYSRSISRRLKTTMWKVMKKKIVGGSTSCNSCLSQCHNLLIMTSEVMGVSGCQGAPAGGATHPGQRAAPRVLTQPRIPQNLVRSATHSGTAIGVAP